MNHQQILFFSAIYLSPWLGVSVWWALAFLYAYPPYPFLTVAVGTLLIMFIYLTLLGTTIFLPRWLRKQKMAQVNPLRKESRQR